MKNFKYTDEVENWLEPMEYEQFWHLIRPYNLVLQPYDHCEQQIADGEVSREVVLDVLKHMARMELAQRFDLHWKPPTPWVQLVETH